MYCIFSTLPLDVENTVIHTQNSEGGGDCRIRKCGFVLRMNSYIFSTLPLDVENIVIHTQNSEGTDFEISFF